MPMETHDDFAFEHAPGLPEPLPRGEELLWQGKPTGWRLAVDSLSIRWVIGYFAFLAVWRVASAIADHGLIVALASALPLLVLGTIATLILWGFSVLQARQAVYSITSNRVIMRTGAALQVTLQIPYTKMENAALDLNKDGSGTIAFECARDGGAQLSYLVLWPHVRPWHMRMPQPAFRSIPQAEQVAGILRDAAEGQMAQPKLTARAAPAKAAETPAAAADAALAPAE